MILEPRIVDLHERDVRLFPRSEIIDHAGRSLILPETRDLKAIDIRDVSEGVQLRASGLIGHLPLTTSITLNIRPKFPLGNLWYMLDRADESYERISPTIRFYERADEQAPHHLLARAFCHFLQQILATGIIKGYMPERHSGFFKPKVNFGKTLSQFLARGDVVNSVSDVFTFSNQLAVNRLLQAGCLQFFRVIPNDKKWHHERRLLSDALASLVALQPIPVAFGDLRLVETVPMRIRDAYEGALTVYSVLNGITQLGFSYNASGSKMPSFLFCLDDVFESFVRNICRNLLHPHRIAALDGNKPQHQGFLFSDSRRYLTKPDIILRSSGKIIALLEVKYKPKLDESDRYQLISHSMAAGTPVGVWISPAVNADKSGLEYVGVIAAGIRFYHYRLDISSDIEAASKRMITDIHRLVTEA
jgi:5-methylcytosine-specific restriction endonuclease McrBC regulatory subunit McrC